MRGRNYTARGRNEQRTGVLVVDAMEKDREVMSRFLSSWDFEPVEASNAREALEITSRQAVSIAVISDPGRGTQGMELVRALRDLGWKPSYWQRTHPQPTPPTPSARAPTTA